MSSGRNASPATMFGRPMHDTAASRFPIPYVSADVRYTITGGAPMSASSSVAVPDAASAAEGRRVLVVDDNADAAHSLAEVLSLAGHVVEVAFDGPTALDSVRLHRPSVVFCDIGLPGMSGYEVARRLRASAGSGLRLIAVSGYAQPQDVTRAMEAGFDGYVAKPCNPAELDRLLA